MTIQLEPIFEEQIQRLQEIALDAMVVLLIVGLLCFALGLWISANRNEDRQDGS